MEESQGIAACSSSHSSDCPLPLADSQNTWDGAESCPEVAPVSTRASECMPYSTAASLLQLKVLLSIAVLDHHALRYRPQYRHRDEVYVDVDRTLQAVPSLSPRTEAYSGYRFLPAVPEKLNSLTYIPSRFQHTMTAGPSSF